MCEDAPAGVWVAIWSIMDVSSWGMSHPAIMKMMVLQIGWKMSLSLHVLSEIQSINALLGKSSPIFREFNTACKINIIPNAKICWISHFSKCWSDFERNCNSFRRHFLVQFLYPFTWRDLFSWDRFSNSQPEANNDLKAKTGLPALPVRWEPGAWVGLCLVTNSITFC